MVALSNNCANSDRVTSSLGINKGNGVSTLNWVGVIAVVAANRELTHVPTMD